MNWEAVSAVSQALGTMALVLTVVYLAVQIRKNRIATQSQTHYLATAAGAQTAGSIASSEDLSRIYRVGLSAPDQLQQDESFRFALLAISQFRRYENLYFQQRAGLIDEDYWIAQCENILWFFHRPGIQAWWMEKRLTYSKGFRDFLESSSPAALGSPRERRV